MSDMYDRLLEPFDDEEPLRDEQSSDNTPGESSGINDPYVNVEQQVNDPQAHVDDEPNHDCAETEAVNARIASLPKRPSQSEVDAHMLTHLPFRSWCPHCVRGKSKGKPHKSRQ